MLHTSQSGPLDKESEIERKAAGKSLDDFFPESTTRSTQHFEEDYDKGIDQDSLITGNRVWTKNHKLNSLLDETGLEGSNVIDVGKDELPNETCESPRKIKLVAGLKSRNE